MKPTIAASSGRPICPMVRATARRNGSSAPSRRQLSNSMAWSMTPDLPGALHPCDRDDGFGDGVDLSLLGLFLVLDDGGLEPPHQRGQRRPATSPTERSCCGDPQLGIRIQEGR